MTSRPEQSLYAFPVDDQRIRVHQRMIRQRFLLRLALFGEDQAAGMRAWPHSGFHGHAAVWVPEDDRAVATRLARYCARNPAALQRLTYDRAATVVTMDSCAASIRAESA